MADRINVCRDGKAIYDIVLTQSFDGLKEQQYPAFLLRNTKFAL